MTYYIILWGLIAITAIIVEAVTTELVSIWFMPASIISLILAICHVDFWIQILVFAVATVLFMLLFRAILKKKIRRNPESVTNTDALIGEKAIVTVPINNIKAEGQVKIKGQIWSAKMKNTDEIVETNTLVTVTAIEGVKLVCEL